MKTPDPDDMQEDLESGPLKQTGFTSKLQREIEQAIDRKERAKPRMKPFLVIAGIGAVTAVLLLYPWNTIHTRSEALMAMEAPIPMEAQSASLVAPAAVNTALLIGLRTDHEETDSNRAVKTIRFSTYRTMLIAPVRGKLQKTSEGDGILMPYKQNFWKIDSLVARTKTDEIHYLSAHLADQPAKAETFTDDPNEKLNHVETLRFVGNQYLSIAESEEALVGNTSYQADRVWVRTLPQLKEGHTMHLYNKPVDKNHVSLSDLYDSSINGVLSNMRLSLKGAAAPQALTVSAAASATPTPAADQIGELTGESWSIERAPGRWVGKVAETTRAEAGTSERYNLHELPRDLPDKVVNHDELCCSWGDIKANWPNATDALTSPMNDMMVIFEGGKLKFYSYGQAPNSAPELTLDLQQREQLVMAQWATDHYVQEWIDKVDRYLPSNTNHD
ncbi:hypothetical protein [Paenibacillus aestuarii]|uniref:MucB/RseB N-terminal domain-containing protein n=1 Tax=Paenibacillus aestuarii TaxID=516965 RepID=A0ABW0KDB7_9BACL|nr:hypothetical protein [Paenibacillus aestuarii]